MTREKNISYSCNLSLARPAGRVEKLSRWSVFFGGVFVFLAAAPLGAAPGESFPEPAVAGSGDYSEGARLLEQKKWPEAAVVLKSVLRKAPEHFQAALGLARALAFSGRREEALSILWRQADREKGEKRKTLIRRANVLSGLFITSENFQGFLDGLHLLDSGKYGQAIERLEKVLELEPDNVAALVRIGQALVLSNDFDSAAERLRVARRLNPMEPEIRLWLGRTLHQRGEIREAVNELRVAAVELEGVELAVQWLAAALVSLGQRNAAIQALEDDTRIRPFHVENLILLARLRSQQPAKDDRPLWGARKELQLVLSRVDDPLFLKNYSEPFPERELRLALLRSPAELKSEAQKLLLQIEGRLEKPESSSEQRTR